MTTRLTSSWTSEIVRRNMADSKRLDLLEQVHGCVPVESKLVQPNPNLDTPVTVRCMLSQVFDLIHDPAAEDVVVNLKWVVFLQSRAGTEAKYCAQA